MAKTSEVFGIRIEPVLSYVERDSVDTKFKEAMKTDHHIVVYGSSKQGKTSLRQKYVSEDRCAIVRCSPNMQAKSIYSAILRQTNVRIETLETSSDTTSGKVASKIGFKAMIPFFGSGGVEASGEVSGEKQSELTQEFISFDFGEAQSIGEILKRLGFTKFIVLENFHYLPLETQQQLAFDLKTFHEIGVRFIVLGIWREANLLATHNGDLQDRILEIPVEPWEPADFERLIEKGSDLLRIKIPERIAARFISDSYGNVGMLQEFLKSFCKHYGINETQENPRELTDDKIAEQARQAKLDSQRGHTLKALQGIAARSRIRRGEEDPLLLPYYLVIAILRTSLSDLVEGIERSRLLQLLRDVHRRKDKDTIRVGDLTNLLSRLPSIQSGIQPPFVYYDSNSRKLKVVDTRQLFVLANIDKKSLEEEIPFPTTFEDAE